MALTYIDNYQATDWAELGRIFELRGARLRRATASKFADSCIILLHGRDAAGFGPVAFGFTPGEDPTEVMRAGLGKDQEGTAADARRCTPIRRSLGFSFLFGHSHRSGRNATAALVLQKQRFFRFSVTYCCIRCASERNCRSHSSSASIHHADQSEAEARRGKVLRGLEK